MPHYWVQSHYQVTIHRFKAVEAPSPVAALQQVEGEDRFNPDIWHSKLNGLTFTWESDSAALVEEEDYCQSRSTSARSPCSCATRWATPA